MANEKPDAVVVVPAAELVETTDITSMALPVAEVVERARMVAEIQERVMIRDVHYGVVPGTQKPSLWQPGAELLALTFQLAPDLHIEDLSSADEIRYRVVASIRHVPTDTIIGAGVGEASSDEEKYRWREAICDEEYESTSESRRRIKYKKQWKNRRPVGFSTANQIRTEPADIANTVLKMATKRARIDGMKSTTAASGVFGQDLEELEKLGVDLAGGEERPAPIEQPKAKGNGKANGNGAPAAANDPGADSTIAELHLARELWHSKGTISEGQANRLHAIARGAGWKAGNVDDLIAKELSCKTAELPFGDVYEAVVSWFQRNKPPSS